MVYVLCVQSKGVLANKIIIDSMRVSSPRLVAKQTCWNIAIFWGIWEEPLSMMIGRAGGWMEWTGLVKGKAGDGDGDWEGKVARGRAGEW